MCASIKYKDKKQRPVLATNSHIVTYLSLSKKPPIYWGLLAAFLRHSDATCGFKVKAERNAPPRIGQMGEELAQGRTTFSLPLRHFYTVQGSSERDSVTA